MTTRNRKKAKSTRRKVAPSFIIRREPKTTKHQVALAAECEAVKHLSTSSLHMMRREVGQLRDNRVESRTALASQLKDLDRQISVLNLKTDAIDAVLRQTR